MLALSGIGMQNIEHLGNSKVFPVRPLPECIWLYLETRSVYFRQRFLELEASEVFN